MGSCGASCPERWPSYDDKVAFKPRHPLCVPKLPLPPRHQHIKTDMAYSDKPNSDGPSPAARGRFLRAAEVILRKEQRPLTVDDMTKLAVQYGYLHTAGRTPASTLRARLSMAL